MVDAQLSTRLEDSIKKSFRSCTAEFEKNDKDERKRYIDLVEKSSSSQPKSTYEADASLTEFELKKILLDKIQKSKSYRGAQEHKDLYDALIKSYKLDKDLFESYGKVYSLKRDREDKDKDEDPPAGSDQGLKKRKTNKDIEPSRGSKSKESKSSSSKGTKSQPKSSGKSAQAEELVFEAADTEMPLNQGDDLGNTDDQPNDKAALRDDWFKKPERTPTPDSELYVMHNMKIENLTQEYLIRPAFDLLKGTCKSIVELEYHFKECYKAVTDRLEWTNPEGHGYPFDLSKPLPLIEDQVSQVVPANYFINNDLEYLKSGSSSRKYTTSTTKTKAAKYDTIDGIEDMVPSLWSPVNVAYDKYAMWGITHWERIIIVTHVKFLKWYDYGYLEEIEVRREDQQLYKFREGDFPRLNLHNIEDMMFLLVQKKLSNLERDVIYDLNVALWMFTRRVVILMWVEDLQLGVESYQKKLNITKPETFRLMRSDELYKVYDGTLTSVLRVLHDIASSLRMDYLPKRRWSKLDRRRSRIMIKAIDQQLFERSIVETDKVIHTVETDIVKLMVEIEIVGMIPDEFDKEIGSSDGLQPKQADLSYVHALNELHLHEIRVVPSKHEADQDYLCASPEPV
ncbi:hypothetical protein Tco_0968720 [Tanacetum coccineum]